MIASRRLINLAGTLLVVIALVAGTMLTALPIYFEARALNAQEQDVAGSNQLLQAQIDALRVQEAELPQLERELTDLQDQLPSIPQLDDVTQLVVKAAGKAGARIESVEFGERVPFTPRDAAVVNGQLPQTATGVTPSATPEKAPTDANVADTDSGDGPTTDADTASAPAPATPANSNQLQFPVTITVSIADQQSANRFLDGLRVGPRLLQIESVTASSEKDDNELTLAVVGLVFVSLT